MTQTYIFAIEISGVLITKFKIIELKMKFSHLCHVIFLCCAFSIFLAFLLDHLVPHKPK